MTTTLKWVVQVLMSCLLALVATGCTMTPGPNSFTPGEAMSMGQVTPATVLEVRKVKIRSNASTTSAGSLAGAVVGGVAGHSVGGGNGQALMTVGGVILGSILGRNAENAASAQDALQVIMRTQDGRTISVVQPLGVNLYQGQAVWLTRYQTETGERYRVEPRSSGN
ncbi:outer membrane lipoprotein [Mangrovitalea sediminis]|uniref:glycine zipper 2TM domain-containing protein n=1 Tax=Mangrovitalea sediminis TaxID=1982043 RepID=UPI000BE590FC|nr:glycine zipper 2TM domain-containing protein [Mangrovitalea sediminis]